MLEFSYATLEGGEGINQWDRWPCRRLRRRTNRITNRHRSPISGRQKDKRPIRTHRPPPQLPLPLSPDLIFSFFFLFLAFSLLKTKWKEAHTHKKKGKKKEKTHRRGRERERESERANRVHLGIGRRPIRFISARGRTGPFLFHHSVFLSTPHPPQKKRPKGKRQKGQKRPKRPKGQQRKKCGWIERHRSRPFMNRRRSRGYLRARWKSKVALRIQRRATKQVQGETQGGFSQRPVLFSFFPRPQGRNNIQGVS